MNGWFNIAGPKNWDVCVRVYFTRNTMCGKHNELNSHFLCIDRFRAADRGRGGGEAEAHHTKTGFEFCLICVVIQFIRWTPIFQYLS